MSRGSEFMKCSPDADCSSELIDLSSQPIYPSVYLSNYLSFIHQSMYPSSFYRVSYPFIFALFLSAYDYLSIYVSICLCVYLSISLLTYHLSTHPSRLSIYASCIMCLSVYVSISLFFQSASLCIYLSVCLPTYLVYASMLSIVSILSSCLSGCLSTYCVSLSDHNTYAQSLPYLRILRILNNLETSEYAMESNQMRPTTAGGSPFHQALMTI